MIKRFTVATLTTVLASTGVLMASSASAQAGPATPGTNKVICVVCWAGSR